MEPAAPNAEGDPYSNAFIFRLPVLLLSASLLITSCSEKKKVTKPAEPPADSTTASTTKPVAPPEKPAIKKKKIYLTFDDGPNKGTLNVLNAVSEDSIPATFFIVGTHTDDSQKQKETWELLKADTSVDLCNHSFSHADNRYTKYYSDPAAVVKDIAHNGEILSLNNNIVRMPGRNAWRIDSVTHNDIKESKAAFDSVYAAGFDIMGWDVEWTFDHKTLKPDTAMGLLLRRIENMLDAGKTRTKDNLVLLAHDQSFQTEEAVGQLHYLFRELKNNEAYEFALAKDYPGIRKNKIPPPAAIAADSLK